MRHEPIIARLDVHPVICRLTEIRMAWGLSVKQIAGRIGVSHFTIAHVESGQKQIGLKLLTRWARELGYDVSLWPTTTKDSAL